MQLKIRVWNKSENKMYYPEANEGEYNHYLQIGLGGFWLYNKDGKLVCSSINGDVLMLYTGLKDRNRKEIYKGDILIDCLTKLVIEVRFGYCKKYGFTGWYCEEVDGHQYAFNGDYGSNTNSYVEIIGNIYEHPHLLNPAGGQPASTNMQHDPKEQQEEQESAGAAEQAEVANETNQLGDPGDGEQE